MIQSIFILNSNGEVIIEKHFQGLVNRSVCDTFWEEVSKAESPQEVLPVIAGPKSYLVHIQHHGLFILATVQNETPPLMVIEFLTRMVEIFQDYFKEVNEENLKEGFTTVYLLLDEMVDNGLPFNTEPNILKEMINAPTLLTVYKNIITVNPSGANQSLPSSTMSAVPWRKPGIKYTSNEVYFDIIEEIDCIIDSNGIVVSAEISGEILANCRLSGMPDLTMTFANPRILDDVSFHPCVRLNRFEHDKVISFIPPDGNFKLLSYRVHGGGGSGTTGVQISLPIYVKPQVTFGEGGGRVEIMVGTKNNQNKQVENVSLNIPFPKEVISTNLTANFGVVKYDETTKVASWQIGKLPKERSPLLSGSAALPPGGPPESKPVITAQFKVVMMTASGLKVESLAMHNEKYKPYKGVRTITKAGNFQVRA